MVRKKEKPLNLSLDNSKKKRPSEDHGGWLSSRNLILLLAFVSFLVYANTLNNGYAYDDYSVITQNRIVTKGISAIPEILSTPYRYGFFKTGNDLYRPLSLVMFSIEYQLFDGRPFAGHFMNVLLFIGCVVLMFLFLDKLFDKTKTGVVFIATLLFVLHPVHTEVVANIKSRDELLCFFLSFLSLTVYIRYIKSGKAKLVIFASVFYFLSLMAKETSITFIAIIPFIFFLFKNENKKLSLYATISCCVAASVFLLIRFIVLDAYDANNSFDISFIDNELVHAPSLTSKYATAILVLGKYLKLLILPYPLVCDYSYNSIPFVNFGNIWVVLSLALYLLLALVAMYRLRKFPKDPYAFGITFFLITISIFSNILFPVGAIMAERFVFFASAGFCLLPALLIEDLAQRNLPPAVWTNKKIYIPIILVSVTFGTIVVIRNNDWTNSETLYRADIKHSPGNARLYFFLGNELLINGYSSGDPAAGKHAAEEATGLLKKALDIYPEYADAHRVAGNGYFMLSQFDSSEIHYKRALLLKPEDIEAWNNLDVLYFNTQQYRQSIAVCNNILRIDSSFSARYNNIGVCYLHLGVYDSAIINLKWGLSRKPNLNSFNENLALAYKMNNQQDSAKKYEHIARLENPNFRVY